MDVKRYIQQDQNIDEKELRNYMFYAMIILYTLYFIVKSALLSSVYVYYKHGDTADQPGPAYYYKAGPEPFVERGQPILAEAMKLQPVHPQSMQPMMIPQGHVRPLASAQPPIYGQGVGPTQQGLRMPQ
ncbi:uncharacterized protein LOC135399542 [Ornithodoros turicata]|uniref:uncharacterized protein LOC135399542 n=1 Tax=Ornithodoros turicata TaxID=34597 RepID=UPI0031388C43